MITVLAVVSGVLGVLLAIGSIGWVARRKLPGILAVGLFCGITLVGLIPAFILTKAEVDACHAKGGVVVRSACIDRSVIIDP